MLKTLLLTLLLVCTSSAFAQLNIDSLSNLDLGGMHNQGLNDIWGYVDEFGNEYAIVGGTKGTSIVDISDPTNPVEVFFEIGLESVWRDCKTYGDFAYITTEASNGLLIIDLSPLPASSILPVAYYNGPVGQGWSSAHNLYVDTLGYAYIFGADRGTGGCIILDVATDPMNPTEIGVFDDWYVHDGFAEGDTMYLGHISDGFFSVVDIQDRANPVLLGTHPTPSVFTHNVWSSGGQYAFTTDEVSDGYLGAYDISDPTNIIELDRIQSSPGAKVIPHNTHVMGNFLITSYYSDGVTVHDITHPYNMVEVGNYDTYPTQTTGYDGCWGAFPFFPSGTMVASDRSEGLFVLGPTYLQAAYLEGTITNSVTLLPIDFVETQILGHNQVDQTNLAGFYATGIATVGTYDVEYSKVGYFPQTISVNLVNGIITTQDVVLVPIPPYSLTITVLEEGTNNPIDGADILLEAQLIEHLGATNALGEEDFTMFYEETYRVTIGKWGYLTHCESIAIDNTTGVFTIYLKPGIYDDFVFDFGWTTAGSATGGLFVRDIPIGTAEMANPGFDSDNDCNDYCYVSGNADVFDFNADDIDDGDVILRSPLIDLTGYSDPYVGYERWFFCEYGILPPGDSLEVFVSNGTITARIDVQTYDPSINSQWIEKGIRILDYVPLTATMQFTFFASDYATDINITEVAVDRFYISEAEFVNIEFKENDPYVIYPNPAANEFNIDGLTKDAQYEIVTINGRKVLSGSISPTENKIDVTVLQDGVYFIRLEDQMQKIVISQ
ncbi:MAG: choice-of-anchor B family protein [Crocinitomicaceae bacterium]|tara:strand:+ start:18983 stop:21319 length:2337 start_codon:yes stop_codon:yes gene_type:complete